MKQAIHNIIFIITVLAFSSCSLLTKTVEKETVTISDNQLSQLINQAVIELVDQYWLTDFLTKNNERPIIMTSKITSLEYITINKNLGYKTFDLEFSKTGQVRVVKSNTEQRTTLPTTLASGKSVDFVVTSTIEERIQDQNTKYLFTVNLWNHGITPVSTLTKEFEIKITE